MHAKERNFARIKANPSERVFYLPLWTSWQIECREKMDLSFRYQNTDLCCVLFITRDRSLVPGKLYKQSLLYAIGPRLFKLITFISVWLCQQPPVEISTFLNGFQFSVKKLLILITRCHNNTLLFPHLLRFFLVISISFRGWTKKW